MVLYTDHSLLVPPQLQELYDMYIRELDERNLDRVMALDKVTIHTLKVRNNIAFSKASGVHVTCYRFCMHIHQMH